MDVVFQREYRENKSVCYGIDKIKLYSFPKRWKQNMQTQTISHNE